MAYRETLRRQALEDWRHRTLVWAAGTAFAAKRPKPPTLPRILRTLDDDDDS